LPVESDMLNKLSENIGCDACFELVISEGRIFVVYKFM
jgi:hypothetical protein